MFSVVTAVSLVITGNPPVPPRNLKGLNCLDELRFNGIASALLVGALYWRIPLVPGRTRPLHGGFTRAPLGVF